MNKNSKEGILEAHHVLLFKTAFPFQLCYQSLLLFTLSRCLCTKPGFWPEHYWPFCWNPLQFTWDPHWVHPTLPPPPHFSPCMHVTSSCLSRAELLSFLIAPLTQLRPGTFTICNLPQKAKAALLWAAQCMGGLTQHRALSASWQGLPPVYEAICP